jgi:hypothetical protein
MRFCNHLLKLTRIELKEKRKGREKENGEPARSTYLLVWKMAARCDGSPIHGRAICLFISTNFKLKVPL